MQDEQIVELVGFDKDGVLVGRAKIDWRNGGWTVCIANTFICNTWSQTESERVLRVYGAVEIKEGNGIR